VDAAILYSTQKWVWFTAVAESPGSLGMQIELFIEF